MYCGPWGHKELDRTEQLIGIELELNYSALPKLKKKKKSSFCCFTITYQIQHFIAYHS